uniref:Cadherin N-terminal domain-containing protein n=1 Tax=Junco hyemalis TaxID=40217 RepID=A0A8C5IJP8_JUNHY
MALARQVLCVCALLGLPLARAEPIRYSVAEEAESGSLVGELAEDAGLTPAQLSARRTFLSNLHPSKHFLTPLSDNCVSLFVDFSFNALIDKVHVSVTCYSSVQFCSPL